MKLAALVLVLASPLAAQVGYTPQPLVFGSVKLGTTSITITTTLKNTSAAAFNFCGNAGCVTAAGLSKSRMAGSSDFHYVTEAGCNNPFAAGATCTLSYNFKPTSVGSKIGSNIVATSAGEFAINFTGTGADTVTVPPPPPTPPPPIAVAVVRLNVAGTLYLLLPSGTWQSIAVPEDAAGNTLVRTVTWRASTPTVATVDATGFIRALSPGTDTITATAGGVSGFFLVDVRLPAPPPPPIVAKPPWCGSQFPAMPGCGMRASSWALLGVTSTVGTQGPWFFTDSTDQMTKVVRCTVKDSTP